MVETVTVKDKNGKPVEGLTAKDFTVTEDGAPQSISFFEFRSCRDELPQPAPRRPPSPSPASDSLRTLTPTQIAPETPGDIRYRDRRLLALYFDMTAMPPAGPIARARRRAEVHPHPDDSRPT